MAATDRLTPSQIAYLARFDALDGNTLELLEASGKPVDLAPEQTQVLLGILADRLQQRGFDHNYALTDEGRMIESIIDVIRVDRAL